MTAGRSSASVAEVPVPTRRFPEAPLASSVQSTRCGLRVLWVLTRLGLHRKRVWRQRQFESLVGRYAGASAVG